jgi:hypothetical protein
MNMPLRLITVNSQVQKLLNLILKKVTSTSKAGMREVMSKCKQGCNPWHTGAGVVRCILSGILNTIPKSITLIHATFHLEPSKLPYIRLFGDSKNVNSSTNCVHVQQTVLKLFLYSYEKNLRKKSYVCSYVP